MLVDKRRLLLSTYMIALPYFFLPFPPAVTISYRVFRCPDDIEPHPARALELARREIVEHWTTDATILSAPLVYVDMRKQCIWLFAIGDENDASDAVERASYHGLVGKNISSLLCKWM